MTAMNMGGARTNTSSSSGRPEPVLFEKYEGLRNDFLVLDERRASEPSLSLARRIALCDRHAGVGADGVLTLLKARAPGAIVRMHVTNADGSVPEMCGNGLRCVSRWLLEHGLVGAGEVHHVDTDAGVYEARVQQADVVVQMRGATLDDACSGGPLIDEEVEAGSERLVGTAVSVGNPHLVLTAPADKGLAGRLGPLLEHHPRFPQRVNVGFAEPLGAAELGLVVWERGAGLTEACGTGATAAVAAFVRAGRFPADEEVLVHLPGGDLFVSVSADLSRIRMRGPARRVFKGETAWLS
jgi:diaminopimelate epimerase